jgi:carboxyl-terminal processing protease
MKKYKKLLYLLFLLSLIFTGFISGYFLREVKIIRSYYHPYQADIKLVNEAYYMLKDSFVDMNDYKTERMIHGAIQGMVESLKDPYTSFFNPEKTKRFIDDADGKFDGIGIEITSGDRWIQVVSPLKETPAEKAGILPGDSIVKINEFETIGMSSEEAANLIRGEKGTDVTLYVVRDFSIESKPKEFIITRDTIQVPSISWNIIDDKIAMINLYHFNKNSYLEFKEIALDIIKSSVKGIVLDLRNNPGGYLDVSKEIGGLFLEEGSIFVIESSTKGQNPETTNGTGRLSEYPIIILMNKGSASASEILAGALRDNRSIKIVGQTSFGKGSIQRLRRLSDGSSIKITVAQWLTPSEENITGKGLIPDIEIDDFDLQTEKAIELIKEII